jgi:hypothetical protein
VTAPTPTVPDRAIGLNPNPPTRASFFGHRDPALEAILAAH